MVFIFQTTVLRAVIAFRVVNQFATLSQVLLGIPVDLSLINLVHINMHFSEVFFNVLIQIEIV